MKLVRGLSALIQTPFAVVMDIATLGNFGEGTTTTKVWQEAKDLSDLDEALDVLERIKEIVK